MNQWIIDRYNKGQDKWGVVIVVSHLEVCDKLNKTNSWATLELYDFLFNPKWGFAKSFWEGGDICIVCGEFDSCVHQTASLKLAGHIHLFDIPEYEYHLQQLAISKDPLKYLEQFKETTDD